MTPEQEMSALIASVWPQSGHWPYTRDAEIYIGFRPGEETLKIASDRILRTTVRYDIVIAAVRGDLALQMEALRYKLYAALLKAGWTLDGAPGPETYAEGYGLFMWPLTAAKGYAIGADGQPYNLAAAMEVKNDEA